MASRKEQKEAARRRRLAEEQALAQRAARARRMQMLGGVLVGAVVVVAALIAINSSGAPAAARVPKPNSPQARQAVATVTRLLSGIPQHGTTLGSPNAKVTVTEFGDLVCPICKEFALGAENQLIANDVRAGRVKLVYRALETASLTANNSMFVPGQVAARAAGEQNLGWDYIELFYHEQGDETTSYVTNGYLEGLAEQIPGLNYARWSAARQSSALAAEVRADEQAAAAAGYNSTPTIVVSGPKGQAPAIVGATDYGTLESVIRSVS
ncbi:MAG TPA: thioredoxin domain-containing protein [Solirubrobacteraceae bacterium]|nr:thioredoxin domain-containing protein [Solirubrobacteraceae bacterium]